MELESATGKLNAYFDERRQAIMAMIERLVNMDSFSQDGGRGSRFRLDAGGGVPHGDDRQARHRPR